MDTAAGSAYVRGMDCVMRGWLACVLSIAACGPSLEGSSGDTSGGADDDAAQEGSTSGVPATTGAGSSEDDGDDAPVDATTAEATSGDTGDADGTTDPGSSTDSTGAPGMALLCPDAQLELGITGVDQGRHEGRRIWASAVEPENDPDMATPVVIVEDIVTGGAFELSCPAGLSENMWYPSIAVVIDADDDGTCSDGDLGWTMQLFAWSDAQIYAFDGTDVFSTAGDRPWLITSDAWQPVAEIQPPWGTPVCEYYFPVN